jgi:hypothetical protein
MADRPKLGICPFLALLFHQHAFIRKRQAVVLFHVARLVPKEKSTKHFF